MRRTYLVIAMCANRLACKPMVILADDEKDALAQATNYVQENLDKFPPMTRIECYDTETEVTYIGKPTDEEMRERDEKHREEKNEEDRMRCTCANNVDCPYLVNGGECEKLGAKPCTDSPDDGGLDSADEDRMYEPGELLFAITPNDPTLEEETGVKFIIYMTTTECWETMHAQSDDLGGHNVSVAALEAAGLCDAELMESIFEMLPLDGDTEEAAVSRMLDAGFGYSQAFQKFINDGFKPRES